MDIGTFINSSNYFLIKDIVAAGLTIAGIAIAGEGLWVWKRQIKGIKEFEIAYNLHFSLLKLRDSIKHVRNPAIWPSESNAAEQYAKEKHSDSSGANIKNEAYVYEIRWERITNARTEMESHLLGAQVLWGRDILTLVVPLNRKILELNTALRQRFDPILRTKDYIKIDYIIYDSSSENEDDEFSKEINEIIEKITTYIKEKTE